MLDVLKSTQELKIVKADPWVYLVITFHRIVDTICQYLYSFYIFSIEMSLLQSFKGTFFSCSLKIVLKTWWTIPARRITITIHYPVSSSYAECQAKWQRFPFWESLVMTQPGNGTFFLFYNAKFCNIHGWNLMQYIPYICMYMKL